MCENWVNWSNVLPDFTESVVGRLQKRLVFISTTPAYAPCPPCELATFVYLLFNALCFYN